MKTYFTLTISIFIWIISLPVVLGQSEQFAPLGAEWSYHFYQYNIHKEGVYKICVEEEIQIDDKTLTILNAAKSENAFGSRGSEAIYSEEDKVYVYRDSTFYLVFDFAANVGDTIVVFNQAFTPFFYRPEGGLFSYADDLSLYNYFAYRILEIDSVQRDGNWLKRQKIENYGDWDFGSQIVQKLGTQGVGFGLIHHPFGTNPWIFGFGEDELNPLCYSEQNFQVSINDDNDCEEYFAFDEIDVTNPISVFPNPCKDFVNFYGSNFSRSMEIKIYTSKGQLVKKEKLNGTNSQTLNLEKLISGLYYWSIGENSGRLVVK